MRLTDKELERTRARASASRASPSRAPFPVPRLGHLLAKPKPSQPEPLVYCANGQTLSQRLVRPLASRTDPSPQSSPVRQKPDQASDEIITSDFFPSSNPPTPRSAPPKRSRQWQRWTTDIIPQLVPVYIQLIYKTNSLRDTAGLTVSTAPSCNCKTRRLEVAVVRMNGTLVLYFIPELRLTYYIEIEHISLWVCDCNPAPVQLLKGGLFACSPQHPSLAVDLQVLDFVARLFVNLPPNNTAFCNTLEGFLSSRGYKLATKASRRRLFADRVLLTSFQ
jgi:hypothetical protein